MDKEEAWKIVELLKDIDWSSTVLPNTTLWEIRFSQLNLLNMAYKKLLKELVQES